MLKNIYTLILVLLFASGTVVYADGKTVYKKYNSDGVIEFSDRPDKKSKAIHVPQMNTYKQKAFPKATAKEPAKQKPATSYNRLSIISPSNDALIREASGKITVNVKVQPNLNPADMIKIVLNGDEKTTITGKSSTLSFANLNPGSHKLQAFIVNKEGTVLIQSGTTRFFLKRSSLRP